MRASPSLCNWKVKQSIHANLIQVCNGTFYREHPSSESAKASASNPPLFHQLNFELPATDLQAAGSPVRKDQHWAVIGAHNTTSFLEVLGGKHLCIPPNARTYPYLASDQIQRLNPRLRVLSRAIQYVGFNTGKRDGIGTGGISGAYLSARYESRREETDWSVIQYLKGETELNPAEPPKCAQLDEKLLHKVIRDLRLQRLVDMPVSNLSNGQTRRARIAKALLGEPELLLLDGPFMGLDPPTLVSLSPLLKDLAHRSSPLLFLALRPQDPIPDWITHLAVLGSNDTVALLGRKDQVLFRLARWADVANQAKPVRWKELPHFQMAHYMSELYGTPMSGVGDSLTDSGVERYDTYHEASVIYGKDYFSQDGVVRFEKLGSADKAKWHSAKSKGLSELDSEELLILTATLPENFKISTVRGHQKSIRSHLESKERNSSAELVSITQKRLGKPLIELQSVVVKYGEKTVLGHPPPQSGFAQPGLNLDICQGTRLALLGPNGSGKTTLLSLLTSDHPQSYSLPIKFFGRTRLPSPGYPGLSLWEIQARIGHSAPEVHGFFPKHLTVRQVLESAWSETYSSKPTLTADRDAIVDTFLQWWEPELRQSFSYDLQDSENFSQEQLPVALQSPLGQLALQSYPPLIPAPLKRDKRDDGKATKESSLDWAKDKTNYTFGALPFGTQRLLLLLRAMIKQPDVLILDEAFSGLSSDVREKAMCWLDKGESMFLQRRLTNGEKDATHQNASEKHNQSSRKKTITTSQAASDTTSDIIKRWEVCKSQNHRFDVLRLLAQNGVAVSDLSSQNTTNPSLAKLMQQSKEDLLHRLQSQKNPTSEIVQKYKFSGLTGTQALIVVSHVKEEVPEIVDEWIRLPSEEEAVEFGKGVEMGSSDGASIRTTEGWARVWGL